MEYGIQFFPAVGPKQRSAADYFAECLELSEAADQLGYSHIRTVEHYFTTYGGYSPNPIVFLAAVAARTKRIRLVTGAVLPVFNNPLKLAGEIGMLDGISRGRLDVGMARAFLPHEFRRFGISPNESVARFREGLEQIDLLLREENVTHHGVFHDIRETTSYPRPTQLPRPRIYVAATLTMDSFVFAGQHGYSIMAIPMAGPTMRPLLEAYRQAWRDAGHAGNGEVMLAFHMFVDPDGERARRIAKPKIEGYLAAIVEASSDLANATSGDYAGYDKMLAKLAAETFETQVESGSAWVGTPQEVRAMIARSQAEYGGFEHASMQVNFFDLGIAEARASLDLFARDVIHHSARATGEAAIP